MKRFFFSLIALSAAAIGCTQSAMLETPDFGGTEVSFSPYTGRTPVTKAASIESAAGLANADANVAANADPNGFYVYGFLNQVDGETTTTSVYLENKKVYSPSKGNTANDWTYEGLVYWPSADSESTLDFVAYSANGVGKGLSEVTEDGFTFTVQSEVANQVDLLATAYQAGNTATSSGGSVNLVFHHLLSRVGFKVQSTTNKKVTITALTFTGDMPTQGTLDFKAAVGNGAIPELQPTAVGTPTYNCITGTPAAVTSGRVPGTEYLMIIPHIAGAEYAKDNNNLETDELKGSDHKVNVTYTIEGSDQVRTSTVTLPIGFEFVAGKAYEIVLKISTSSLSFDVQEEDWNTTGNNADINPNEPPVPGDDEEEEEPVIYTETSVTISGAKLDIDNIQYNNAVVSLQFIEAEAAEGYQDTGWQGGFSLPVVGQVAEYYVDDKTVGVAYRKKGSNGDWSKVFVPNDEDGNVTNGSLWEFNLPLDSSTEYELAWFSASRTVNYNSILGNNISVKSYNEWNYTINTSGTLRFFTPSNLDYPFFSMSDVTLDDIVQETGKNQFKATIHGDYLTGQIDGGKIKISEYGLCWKRGSEAPTLMDDKVTTTVATEDNTTTYDLDYTIPNLKPNTTYSVCAYAILAEDRSAYVLDGSSIIPVLSTISTKDQIIYSSVITFTTGVIVNNSDRTDDNEDGSWGSSN